MATTKQPGQMIRKQVYIRPQQDEALKRLADARATTEAKLIRLVYLYDVREPVKQGIASRLISALHRQKNTYLSVQVLAEFMHLAPRKLAMSHQDALGQIISLVEAWPILELHQIPVVFSEDFNSCASVEGVRFVNPLAADFQLEPWI
jgi:hypothetical protein